MEKAYIIDAIRTPVAKAGGMFAHHRPDDLLATLLTKLLQRQSQIDANLIDDVIIGCALPEAEQGLNIARNALLLARYPQQVAGMTINRFCASGLQSIAIAAQKIVLGEAQIMVAGGVESMSMLAMAGSKPRFNSKIFNDDYIGMAFGMGQTAEEVAKRFNIDRPRQDAFALASHQKAQKAIERGYFDAEIIPIVSERSDYDQDKQQLTTTTTQITQDNGVRFDTSLEKLSQLKSAFAKDGTVTAGNSSQRSDGAGVVMLCSEAMLSQFNLTPMAEFLGFSVIGVAPEIMGIGPVSAIPKVLAQCHLSLADIDIIELNEAFAAQSLAVIDQLEIDPHKINPVGSAIALGHPLGATGAIRTATALNTLKREQLTYALITMCIGGGMGAAGIIKNIS